MQEGLNLLSLPLRNLVQSVQSCSQTNVSKTAKAVRLTTHPIYLCRCTKGCTTSQRMLPSRR